MTNATVKKSRRSARLAGTVPSDLPPPSRLARLRAWWQRHKVSQRIEQNYPRVIALAAAILFWFAGLSESEVGQLLKDVLPVAVTLATVLAGFQATAQSVLIALIDSPAWKYLKRVEHDKRLVSYHWETILSLLVFIALSLGVLVGRAVGANVAAWTSLLPAVLGGFLVHAGLSCYRIMRLISFVKRMGNCSDDENELMRLRAERNDAIAALRAVCEEHGNNDWTDDHALANIIDKHLHRYLEADE